jgi:hypothetical protein
MASARARTTPEPWSPYGLEAHRVALLQRRKRMLLAGIVLGFLLLAAVLASTIRTNDDVRSINGSGQVEIQVPEQQRAKPTTLSVSPGRTAVLNSPIQEERGPQRQGGGIVEPPREGINWLGLLTPLAPPIGLAIYAWRVGKQRIAGPLEQVNLGVYKGAMPLELLTAQSKEHVFTSEQARASLFGKVRQDHLPSQPQVVARPMPRPASAGTARLTRVR